MASTRENLKHDKNLQKATQWKAKAAKCILEVSKQISDIAL